MNTTFMPCLYSKDISKKNLISSSHLFTYFQKFVWHLLECACLVKLLCVRYIYRIVFPNRNQGNKEKCDIVFINTYFSIDIETISFYLPDFLPCQLTFVACDEKKHINSCLVVCLVVLIVVPGSSYVFFPWVLGCLLHKIENKHRPGYNHQEASKWRYGA